MASEFAVSQVFAHKKPNLGTRGLAIPRQSTEQLRDHDEDYSEAQALLSNWLSSKLRIDLDIEDEDELMGPDEGTLSAATATNLTATSSHGNFDDFCLSDEEEQSAVSNILQELKVREVLDSVMMEKLVLDDETTPKKFRDPVLTMEARHRQVRENRLQREAEKERQHREKEARQAARQEAKRRERAKEMRRKQEQHRQEELMQQELVRLRREMEQRRAQEQLARQRKRSELHQAAANIQTTPTLLTKQQQNIEQLLQEQWIQAKLHTCNFKCLQRHFSGWHSAVLERQLQMSKAMAFSSWRRQLRAWRAWRAVVWAERRRRNVAKTEEELRTENRKHQLAVESDRRRLLRRCLYEWQVWCRIMREQQRIVDQQQETKRKMTALLSAAAKGHLKTKITLENQPQVIQPELGNQSETTVRKVHNRSDPSSPGGSMIHQDKNTTGTVSGPLQPWQVTRRHTAPTAEEIHKAQKWVEDFTSSTASTGSRFESRHTVQQKIITHQRKLLKEQQEQIARLKEKQNVIDLRLEMERTAEEMEKTMHYAPVQRTRSKCEAHDSITTPVGRR